MISTSCHSRSVFWRVGLDFGEGVVGPQSHQDQRE